MDDPATSQNQDALRDASRGERLQRVMADAGVASRRACEQMIEAGRVTVNGQVVRTLPAWVDPSRDHVRVDGRPIEKPEPHLYLMFNKPARTLATPREGPDDARRSVIDMVGHPLSSRLFPAGRLDFDATGLLLLTNDGDLANRLTHARYGVEKVYQLVVRGTLDDASLERVNKVIGQVAGRAAKEAGAPGPARSDLSILAREEGRTVLELATRDGRALLVRDTLAALGHPVKKMERVAIGPVRLRGVAVGQWRELEREELSQLRRAAAGKPTGSMHAARPAKPTKRASQTRPARPAQATKPVRARDSGGEVNTVDGAPEATAAPRAPRRSRPSKATQRPLIAKRFRGIGKPIDDQGASQVASKGGRGATRKASRSRTGAPARDRASPRPAAAPIADRRRGRGDAINAYRRKPERTAGPSRPSADQPDSAQRPHRDDTPPRDRRPAGPPTTRDRRPTSPRPARDAASPGTKPDRPRRPTSPSKGRAPHAPNAGRSPSRNPRNTRNPRGGGRPR